MLRFGSPTAGRRHPMVSRERWRLWMLFVAACVVLWFMRMLQHPATINRIDSIFSLAAPQQPGSMASDDVEILDSDDIRVEPPAKVAFEGNALVVDEQPRSETELDLSAIKDNTFFRAEENQAWFEILDRLQVAQAGELDHNSVGAITYAQFIEQPGVYRGKVVSASGTVMREEVLAAPTNDIGIEQYHRLVMRPAGGGVWPMVVYSLELPEQFPRGDEIRADVKVHGIFFKNWSYSWQEGLGLAPVILAKRVEWQPAAFVKPSRTEVSLPGVIAVIAAGGALAAIVGWFAWRQSRRPTVAIGNRDMAISLPADTSEAER